MRKMLVALTAVCCLAGCSATRLVTLPSHSELVQGPTIGETRTSEVGDTLTRTAKVTQIPAIHVNEEIIAKATGMAAGNRATIKPGLLIARYTDPAYTCYIAQEPIAYGNFMAHLTGEGGVCIGKSNPKNIVVIVIVPNGNAFYKPTKPIQFESTIFVDRSAPGFYQELIYNGRTGDVVRFLYREFANDLARPAFSQDVQYDLREGRTVGFKGARIEVLDATNVNITYRVLAHFPLPPQ
jgi:hypothetical protein